ncbi:AraC family transcriptional regulator [uncultured Draconibacterium sp.]|uniref:AraC family transcriptional regulator n=1 Tax=uncultured Draconibacterium sp. TaxID=1573823 RepID=UPI003261C24F
MKNTLPTNLLSELQVNLMNVGYVDVGQEWNYANVLSPFSRIYLITSGEGYILPNNTMHRLKPGHLYLIPSFVQCSYHCTDFLEQHYVHFSNSFSTGLNIYDFISIKNEVEALPLDKHLFERLVELNQHKALKKSNPKDYEKENWKGTVEFQCESKSYLETIGILKQLLSRFIVETKVEQKNFQQFSDFRKVFQYINSNLSQEIRVEKLAEIAHYSYDHFTRIFKRTTGLLPLKYINTKRIEKAQILLLTTNMSLNEICDTTGFNNLPYFYRVFQKHTGSTPARYRKMGGLV